jgi:hypothetical protein
LRRLTYENARGESIEFYLSPLIIESLTGIGEVDADLQSQVSPFQDGDSLLDVRVQPRFIVLEGKILKTDSSEIKSYRERILRVCNPKLGLGKITIELDGDIKEIYAAMDGGVAFPERGRDTWQKYLVNWKCPDPYWRDPKKISTPLSAVKGSFRFPFSFPVSFGTDNGYTTLVNDGHVETPITIDIQGPVVNPKITNRTTGKVFRINHSLSSNEVLHIDMNPKAKRVELTRDGISIKNVMGWVDYAVSDFWQLDIGNNTIEYVADAGNSDAIVVVAWHNLYAGI